MSNGYRVYSEKDFLKLQQIVALKFFGFELSQIKALLTGGAAARRKSGCGVYLSHNVCQSELAQTGGFD
jgi:DNA-binding transcriptional MerR regulator